MTPREIMKTLALAFEEMARERYLAPQASPSMEDWRRVFEILDARGADLLESKSGGIAR